MPEISCPPTRPTLFFGFNQQPRVFTATSSKISKGYGHSEHRFGTMFHIPSIIVMQSMSRVRGHTQTFPCRGSPHRRRPAPYLPAQNLPAMPFRQSADPELIVWGNFAKKNTAPKLKEKKYPPGWDFTFPKVGYVSSQEDKVFEWFCFSTQLVSPMDACCMHRTPRSKSLLSGKKWARLTTCKSEALTKRNKFNRS